MLRCVTPSLLHLQRDCLTYTCWVALLCLSELSQENWELLQENERAGVELALLREERGALDSAYAEVRSRKTALPRAAHESDTAKPRGHLTLVNLSWFCVSSYPSTARGCNGR